MPDLGDKASMLLGMLGHPMTTGELHALVKKAIPMIETMEATLGGTRFAESITLEEGRAILQDLDRGGKTEIWKQLIRLEKMGHVRRAISAPNEPHLWWRV